MFCRCWYTARPSLNMSMTHGWRVMAGIPPLASSAYCFPFISVIRWAHPLPFVSFWQSSVHYESVLWLQSMRWVRTEVLQSLKPEKVSQVPQKFYLWWKWSNPLRLRNGHTLCSTVLSTLHCSTNKHILGGKEGQSAECSAYYLHLHGRCEMQAITMC